MSTIKNGALKGSGLRTAEAPSDDQDDNSAISSRMGST
jgi:hypothetical protein